MSRVRCLLFVVSSLYVSVYEIVFFWEGLMKDVRLCQIFQIDRFDLLIE